jgi:UDP:flavonoid glycosyltransferase YjiC (YdhE family)
MFQMRLWDVRWLVTCVPQAGHFGPLRPLVTALREQGDEVLVASGHAIEETALAAGARFVAAGQGLDAWFALLASRVRGEPGDGLPPDRIAAYFVPRLFAEIGAVDMVDDALRSGRDFRADAVLFDTDSYCGPLVAEVLGVPSVHHAFGALPDTEVQQLTTDALSPLWRSFGLDVPPAAGLHRGPTVTVFPPSLDPGAKLFESMRTTRATAIPIRPHTPKSPPLVYLTLGTLWADVDLIRAVITALADEPVQLVITTGNLDPTTLGDLPDNVSAERYRPQEELLPECSLVIHHAGAGTLLGASAHGLPQIALPRAADNFINAELLARSGAATVLMPGEVSTDTLRIAVRAALTQPGYRDAAATIAAELASLPSPHATADALRAELERSASAD